MSIADTAIKLMTRDNRKTIMWGDGLLVDICHEAGVKAHHPIVAMQKVLAALERDHRFTKHMTLGHDHRARPRRVRSFEIKWQFCSGEPT